MCSTAPGPTVSDDPRHALDRARAEGGPAEGGPVADEKGCESGRVLQPGTGRFIDEAGCLVGTGSTMAWRGAVVAFPEDPALYEVVARQDGDPTDVVRVRRCPFDEY